MNAHRGFRHNEEWRPAAGVVAAIFDDWQSG